MTFRDWRAYKKRQYVYAYMRAAKIIFSRLTGKLPKFFSIVLQANCQKGKADDY